MSDHSLLAGLWRASVLVVAPYFVGRFLGRSVDRDTPMLARSLRWLGIGSPFQTPWDLAWEQVETAPAGVLVTVSLDDGRKIAGQFARASRASVSPEAPEVYLEEAYETTSAGELVVYDRGAHIDGAKIAAVAFQALRPMLKEILQKLDSRRSQARRERRDAAQGSSRERVRSYGSVSGKGQRVSQCQEVKDNIENRLS